MTTQQLRIDSFDRILSKLRQMFYDVEPIPVDREMISESTKTPSWMIARSLLVLCQQGHLIKKSEGVYVKFDGFHEVTPFALNEWVTAYNQKALDKSRAKKKQLADLQTELNLESTPLERATKSFQNVMAEYKYGFVGTGGASWYTSLDEAAEKAKEVAQHDGLERIDLVQRVGVVINQPQVTLF